MIWGRGLGEPAGGSAPSTLSLDSKPRLNLRGHLAWPSQAVFPDMGESHILRPGAGTWGHRPAADQTCVSSGAENPELQLAVGKAWD